jgi:hypothetical protein
MMPAAADSASPAVRMSQPNTLAPSEANSLAIAFPIPLATPLTATVFISNWNLTALKAVQTR